MSSADKNKPAGKSGKRNRKPEQRNHQADRQISSLPNEQQDAEEQIGAAAEPGHVGSNGAAAQPANVASISPAAEPADEALIDALTEPADVDSMDAYDADEISSISPAPEPAHAAQISRVAEPAEVTPDTNPAKRADVVPIGVPAQPAELVPIAAAAFEGVPISVQTIATAYGDYTRKSFEQSRSFVDKLTRVRSLDKALELQIEFARQSYETFVGEMQKICGLHNALARQSLKPLERFMTNTMRGAR
jgi:hypothetical protein